MVARTGGTTPRFGGGWTEQKLNILENYLDDYTKALKNKGFRLIYIDAFAGSGSILGKLGSQQDETDDAKSLIMGSAARAIKVDNKHFDKLIFVEKDPRRCSELRHLRERHDGRDIQISAVDANHFLQNLKQSQYGNWRGVLFVDPFGAQLEWDTVEHVAKLERLDMWLLFPVGAIGRMLPLSKNPEDVDIRWAKRLDIVYGGNHWRKLYSPSLQQSFFDTQTVDREPGVDGLLNIYQNRLKKAFGDRLLRESRTLKNSKNTPLFEFMFCAGHPRGAPLAKRIARHLIEKI